jgi:pyruvate dehydrogenase E2 component (dihydrolipoamide acetyltransferase)
VEVEAEGSGLFHPVVESGAELPPGALIGWLLEVGEELPGAVAGTPSAEQAPAPAGRLFSSPNARRIARERGIDFTRLNGTGPGGRIITADVLDAAAAQQSPPAAQSTAPAAQSTAPAAQSTAPAAQSTAPAAQSTPPAAQQTPSAAQPAAQPTAPATPAAGPRAVTPLVRRDAAAAGVDLTAVVGTGPGGKILRSDVAAAAARPAPEGIPEGTPETSVIPLTGMRRVIATRMHASLQEMAQLTLGTEATMDAAVVLRAQLKEQWQQAGIPVPTITDLVVRAAALALREHPRLNASVHDDAIHIQPEINVGLAVALEEGLMVPVLKRADLLPLSAIAAESRRLAQAARAGRLTLPELEGGTFTVSTLGSFGIDFFTPVITPGQVAILGVGRLRDSVRWAGENGTAPVRTQVLTLSVTFDHRAVDGAPAAEYLRSVAARLANPLTLLA